MTEPADLPIPRGTKFETVINLKGAKALGLVFPTTILLHATQMIDPDQADEGPEGQPPSGTRILAATSEPRAVEVTE